MEFTAGCQIILFTTGLGAPQSFPFVPVVNVCGNQQTVEKLADFIDIDVSQILLDGASLDQTGNRILEEALQVASGRRTKAEAIGYSDSTAIYQKSPIVQCYVESGEDKIPYTPHTNFY